MGPIKLERANVATSGGVTPGGPPAGSSRVSTTGAKGKGQKIIIVVIVVIVIWHRITEYSNLVRYFTLPRLR